MNELSEETKKTLLSIIDDLLLDTTSRASEITLYNFISYNRSFTMELFSQNIEDYLDYMISQHITSSFSIELEKLIVDFCEVLIQNQGGLILNAPKQYDLKFRLSNDVEYWIDIKSNNDQYCTKHQTIIDEHKEKAEREGKIYKLYLYDDEKPSDNDYTLNGSDFWALITGFENARVEILRLINGSANKISISSIIKETKNRLLNEWRMQD